MKTKNKYTIILAMLLVFMLTLTACGSAPASAQTSETANLPMDSVTSNVTEPGIQGYASSLKKDIKGAQKEGDVGTLVMTLHANGGPYCYIEPWWVDGYRQHCTADVIVVAGEKGCTYEGSVECHKCGYHAEVEGIVEETEINTFTCECKGNNYHFGLKKIVTIVVIPLVENAS